MARKTALNTAERDIAALNEAREFLFKLFEKGYSPKDALAELGVKQAAAHRERDTKFARGADFSAQGGREAKN